MKNPQSIITKFNQAASVNQLAMETMADCLNSMQAMLVQAVNDGTEQKKVLEQLQKDHAALKQDSDKLGAENESLKAEIASLKDQISKNNPVPDKEEVAQCFPADEVN